MKYNQHGRSLAGNGMGLMYVNDTIKKINISEGVERIDEYAAFAGIKNISEITIPKSVKKIGEDAFAHCEALKKVKMSDKIEEIGSGAFYECICLTEIAIPQSVITMGYQVFYGIPTITVSVPWKEGEKPDGWNDSWAETKEGCSINIVYAQ